MIQICKFCEERDIRETIPGLAIDIQGAIDSGVVIDSGTIEEHNDIESPDSIHTRVRDVFHALDLQKSYLSVRASSAGSTVGSSENSTVSVSTGGAGAPTQSE